MSLLDSDLFLDEPVDTIADPIDENEDDFLVGSDEEELIQHNKKGGKQSICNLILCGREHYEEDEVKLITQKAPEYYLKKNIWTLFGCFKSRNLANCCGLFGHKKNFYDCFGFRDTSGKLGYFLGVLIPVILDCFGVIIFLRLPMIVGNAGILLALFLFTLGYIICVLTVLSAAAIATSGEMGDGGTYYMVSRILGPVLGGSIGLILFLANVAGTALYVIGFVDTFDHSFPEIAEFFGIYMSKIIIGTAILLVITLIVFIGASLFSKTAFIVWIVLMASIVSVVASFGGALHLPFLKNNLEEAKKFGYTGWSMETISTNLWPYHDEQRFDEFSYSCNDTEFIREMEDLAFLKEKEASDDAKKHNHTIIYRDCIIKAFEEISPWDYGVDQETGDRLSFESLFAIFFPAVTGILAGTNLSGDLRNPSKAISKGTFLGIFVTYFIYVIMIIVIGSTVNQEVLVTNYDIVMEITCSEIFIKIGMFCATVSSAMTSLIGSSRILYALGRDNVFPLLGICSIQFRKEPRVALMFTWFGVQLCLFFGHLDVIAPFMTLFFVFTFVIMNLACFLLTVLKPPNFRPTIKVYTWWTCLLGLLSSFVMMFYMDWRWAVACIVAASAAMVVIFVYTIYKPKPLWGNIIDAFLYYISTNSLHRMARKNVNYHVKYWSFKGLLMVSNPRSQLRLIKFLNNFCGHRGGMLVLGNVMVIDDEEAREKYHLFEERETAYQRFVQELKLSMFSTTIHSPTIRQGIQNLMVTSGLGAIKPTCVILGWFERDCNVPFTPQLYSMKDNDSVALQRFDPLREHHDKSPDTPLNVKLYDLDEYMETLKDIFAMKKSLIIARNFRNLDERLLKPQSNKIVNFLVGMKRKVIDMWVWSNGDAGDLIEPSVSFILQLGYLLKTTPRSVWKRYHRLRILAIKTNNHTVKEYRDSLKYTVDKLGMTAEIVIVELIEEDYKFMYDIEMEEQPTGTLNNNNNNNSTTTGSEEVITIDEIKDVRRISTDDDDDDDDEVLETKDDEEKISGSEQEEEGGLEIELISDEDLVEEEEEEGEGEGESNEGEVIKNELLRREEEEEVGNKKKKKKKKKESTVFFFERQNSVSFDNLTIAIQGRVPIITVPGIIDWALTMKQRVKIMNNLIIRNSKNTSVIFLPLPPPPMQFGKDKHEEYYDCLEILTRTSIPTFLVYSLEKVLYLYI